MSMMLSSGLLTEDEWSTEEMTEYVNYLLNKLDYPEAEKEADDEEE